MPALRKSSLSRAKRPSRQRRTQVMMSRLSNLRAPSEEEAIWFYHGLPSAPRLLARLPKEVFALSSGPFVSPPRRYLDPISDQSIVDGLRSLRPAIIDALETAKTPWCVLDFIEVNIEGDRTKRPVVWLGCPPGECSWQSASAAVAAIGALLAEASLADVDVQVRETSFVRLGDGWLGPGQEVTDLTLPFLPTMGIPLAPMASPFAEGSAGAWIRLRAQDKTLLLTARHVVAPANNSGLVEGQAMAVFAEGSFQRYLKSAEDRVQVLRESLHLYQRRSDRLRLAFEAELEEAERAVESLREVPAKKEQMAERIIGQVRWAPPLSLDMPYTEDWALVEMTDNAMTPEHNALYLGDDAGKAGWKMRMHPHRTNKPTFSLPEDFLLRVGGVVPLAELKRPTALDGSGEPALMVIKRGRSTGVTIGRGSAIESARREIVAGVPGYSLEWAVLPETNTIFSAPGDSGAVIVDGKGRAAGLLTAGSRGQNSSIDVTYATPMAWLVERVEQLCGDRVSFI